jgi:hypothetical protein
VELHAKTRRYFSTAPEKNVVDLLGANKKTGKQSGSRQRPAPGRHNSKFTHKTVTDTPIKTSDTVVHTESNEISLFNGIQPDNEGSSNMDFGKNKIKIPKSSLLCSSLHQFTSAAVGFQFLHKSAKLHLCRVYSYGVH